MEEKIDNFSKLPKDNRLMEIMLKGDSKEMQHFDLMEYAILKDPDIGVKFAALKRIHFFKENDRLVPMLKEVDSFEWSKQLEPYLSMALGRVGLITKDEFNKRISG